MAADPLNSTYVLFYALLGGILPALVWLWFWLQEDRLHPEPRQRIAAGFIGGMILVVPVYFLEKLVVAHYGLTPTSYLLWAVIEEVSKLFMAWLVCLRTRDYAEPIDALEYMITVALGFAALENGLFIANPFLIDKFVAGSVAANMRFIGASLVHVVSSAIIGYCIGREFYKGKGGKTLWLFIGLLLAVSLHAVFNLFIIYAKGSWTFVVFGGVWAAAIVVVLLFEKIKAEKS